MKFSHQILLFLLLPCLLASCVTARKVNYMQEPDKEIPSYDDTLSYVDYRLRIGDRIFIYVYSLDEKISKMYNSGQSGSNLKQQMQRGGSSNGTTDLYTYLIDDEGDITFPTVGKIHVKDMTTREVAHLMEDTLSSTLQGLPGYSTISAEVNVLLRTFSVIGMQSGRYNITKEKMTIFEALAAAGDIQEFGDRAQVKLVREINGKTVIKTFDVRSKDIVNSEFYYIEPNDILYIRKINGQAFGINSASTGLAVVASTLSFGVFVYTIVQTGINHVKKYNTNKADNE